MRPVRVPAADLEQPGAEKACARVRGSGRNQRGVGTLGTRPPQDAAVPAPVPSRHWGVPELEAAIVATELWLSDRLAHLAWCSVVGRNTSVAETLVQSTELRLELLWQERHWRLVRENDGPGARPDTKKGRPRETARAIGLVEPAHDAPGPDVRQGGARKEKAAHEGRPELGVTMRTAPDSRGMDARQDKLPCG
jgi:hypothetical protein